MAASKCDGCRARTHLELLSAAKGNVLNDDHLIQTLSESKVKSTEIESREKVAAGTHVARSAGGARGRSEVVVAAIDA